MKQLLFVAVMTLLMVACNQPATTSTGNKDPAMTGSSVEDLSIPYTPLYSTNFEIGNFKYAQIVLNIYKDYDNNIFNNSNLYADTVSLNVSSGSTIKGRDMVINSLKDYRNSITSVKDSIVTFVVLKPKDKDETWVSIWSSEINTFKDGKIDTSKINENWKFNKDGKVAFINMYTAK